MSRSSGQPPVSPPALRKPRPWRHPVLTGLRRPISIVAALAVMVPVALTAASVQAATGRQAVPAASRAPALARAVADARTTGARVAAIDHMMAALHIDVINPANGAVVVPGAARSLTDAYLYTGEVERLALGYATRQRFTLAGLAANLNVIYSRLRVKLTAASLGAAVLKVTQADARNGDSDAVALLPRLVRQLGLLDHPAQDLATKIAVARVRLDPLQAWLVEAAFTLPLVYANPVPAHAASLLPAMTDGVVKRAGVPDSICDDLKPLKKTLIGTAQYAETAVLIALGRAAWQVS